MKKIVYYKHNLYFMLKRRVPVDYQRMNKFELNNLAAAAIQVIDELTSENIKLKEERKCN